MPQAADGLRLERGGTKSLADRHQHVADEFVGNGRTVVKPQREQDLVAAYTPVRKGAAR